MRKRAEVGILQASNFLCPGNTVLSGENAACLRAAELTEAAGGKAAPLAVAGAFHTNIMKPADVRLSEALAGVMMQKPGNSGCVQRRRRHPRRPG